jgi:hypothetical protein
MSQLWRLLSPLARGAGCAIVPVLTEEMTMDNNDDGMTF